MFLRHVLAVIACVAFAGCGGDSTPSQPAPNPPSGGGNTQVRPGARLGWSQAAADAAEASSFQYALYVDGNRTVMSGVSCLNSSTASQFDCSGAMPSMSAGTHSLELAAFVLDGAAVLESQRSAPLRVTMSGLTGGGSTSASTAPIPVATAEQVPLNLALVADGLHVPSDLAVAPDGSVFVAERGGTVRLVRDGALVGTPALDISGELRLPEGGLLSLALDPKFTENGLMYALYAAAAPRNGLEFILARFRGVNGVFAERAVLLDRIAASPAGASGSLRIGPDAKIYVALDSASDGQVAGSFATYNGKVLRLNADATTPDDQAGMTPIFSLDHPQPNAIDWQPATGTLWVVDRVGTDAGRLSAVSSRDASQRRAESRTSYALPAGTGATSAAFYRGDLMPMFRGNLFVAAAQARELMRLSFDPENGSRVVTVERLLRDKIEGVRAVAESPDGALYIAGDTALYRLAP